MAKSNMPKSDTAKRSDPLKNLGAKKPTPNRISKEITKNTKTPKKRGKNTARSNESAS
jgi:hypothetical protein